MCKESRATRKEDDAGSVADPNVLRTCDGPAPRWTTLRILNWISSKASLFWSVGRLFRRAEQSPVAMAAWAEDRTADHNAAENDLRQRLAAAQRALEAKSRSVALASHELRTPLNGILGVADLLSKTPLSPEQADYTQAIATSAAALLALVDDMLDQGKLAAGHWQLNRQPVAIETLIDGVLELLAPRAQAKGIELAAHIAANVPVLVAVDPDQLKRILLNLVGNAIKFTDCGGVAIEVSLEGNDERNAKLHVQVRDSGIGIAIEDQSRIFNEYEQATGATSHHNGGTGLGLAISRDLARAMNGDITLISDPGHGSVFRLQLEVGPVRLGEPPPRPLSGRHILLFSKRTIEPPLLMRRLFDLGASVDLARTGEAARAMIATRPPDAILYDYDEHGSLTAFSPSQDKDLPPVAVIVAPADRHALLELRKFGVNWHLVRPIRTNSLVRVLASMMSGDQAPAAANRADRRATNLDMKPQSNLRTLLADDNEINRLLGRSVLYSFGMTADIAENGALAVEKAIEASDLGHPFDVIMMDLHMPVIDGFAATAAIRAVDTASGHRTFIIALTADLTAESARRALAAGADVTLTKPIEQARLAHILKTLNAKQAAHDRFLTTSSTLPPRSSDDRTKGAASG